ncbi:hypothetical protein H1R20_g10185, partial [Candolleomyces eurysporus]
MFDPAAPIEASVTPDTLQSLSESSKACIKRLLAHFSNSTESKYLLSSEPGGKLAAVLVLLYEEEGELRVLLTTRSKSLRTHPGQTALPGGRVDAEDDNFVVTAMREANEEVGLPLNCPDIHVLGLLDPQISLYRIGVAPVVALLTKPDILRSLKAAEDEVDRIFSHPLEAILDPSIAKKEKLVDIGSEDWPYQDDFYNTSDSQVPLLGNMTYRMHRFRSSASPIKGMTAEVLIKTAEIAYNKSPVYDHFAPGQLRDFAGIMAALKQASKEALNGTAPLASIPIPAPTPGTGGH